VTVDSIQRLSNVGPTYLLTHLRTLCELFLFVRRTRAGQTDQQRDVSQCIMWCPVRGLLNK